MKRFVFLILILFYVIDMSAQTCRKEIRVGFRIGNDVVEPDYCDNASSLSEIIDFLNELQNNPSLNLTCIMLCGSASPEGGYNLNKQLATNRCANVYKYIRQRIKLSDSIIIKSVCSDVWQKLATAVELSDMPKKKEVLYQLQKTPEFTYNTHGSIVDSRMKRLMELNYGRTWNYMAGEFFPVLRNTCVTIVYAEQHQELKPEIIKEPKDTIIVETIKVENIDKDSLTIEVPSKGLLNYRFALKTNILYDALAVPNIGVECYLGKQWTVAADWMHAWWGNDKKHRYWRIYGGGISVRKWLAQTADAKIMHGHHIGINAQLLTFDFEFGGTGYMAGVPGGTLWNRMNYAFGAEYGYSMPIAKRLNIDFSLVAGYMGGRYYEYKPLDGHYVWQATKNRNWWGPTKLEVSLAWFLGRGHAIR